MAQGLLWVLEGKTPSQEYRDDWKELLEQLRQGVPLESQGEQQDLSFPNLLEPVWQEPKTKGKDYQYK